MTRTTTPPQHGERRCYLRGCRRDECAAAHKRYCKEYRVATLNQRIQVNAQPTVDRLIHWTNRGYSQPQMSKATGVSLSNIAKLVTGRHRTTHPSVARRILSAPDPVGIPFHATTDATGTIRRGRALHVIGYPMYQIAAGIPMHAYDLSRMLIDPPAIVRVSVANGVTDLCRRLRWAAGPSLLARRSAQRRNWLGPFAWDDIDNPDELPETGTAEVMGRRELAAYRRQEISHLATFGTPEHEIAARLGMSTDYVTTQLRDMRKAA